MAPELTAALVAFDAMLATLAAASTAVIRQLEAAVARRGLRGVAAVQTCGFDLGTVRLYRKVAGHLLENEIRFCVVENGSPCVDVMDLMPADVEYEVTDRAPHVLEADW
jgi:hypothetical protein